MWSRPSSHNTLLLFRRVNTLLDASPLWSFHWLDRTKGGDALGGQPVECRRSGAGFR